MPLPDGNLLFGFEPKLTDEQRQYVDSIFDNQLTIVNARAGTGKTTLAVACAAVIGKPLIYTFAPVEERTMGAVVAQMKLFGIQAKAKSSAIFTKILNCWRKSNECRKSQNNARTS